MRRQWRRWKGCLLPVLLLALLQPLLHGWLCGMWGHNGHPKFPGGQRADSDPCPRNWEAHQQLHPSGVETLALTLNDLVDDLPPRPWSDLEPRVVPNIVHYVWCGNTTFTFVNYLSVLSAWRVLEPDVIVIHQEFPPLSNNYHTWVEELRHTVPCLTFRPWTQGSTTTEKECGIVVALEALSQLGGVYLRSDVLLTSQNFMRHLNQTFTSWLTQSGDVAAIVSTHSNHELMGLQNHLEQETEFYRESRNFSDALNSSLLCPTVTDVQKYSEPLGDCLKLSPFTELFPVHTFALKTPLGATLRRLFYNTDSMEALKATPNPSTPIPKVVHYVWYHQKNMTFIMYLSVLSSLYVINASRVYIHGDLQLYGALWNKVKDDPRIHMVYREMPREIFGHRVLYTQHKSDILRADILLKYGGIYLDWDAVWLRPIDDVIKAGWECVVNLDHMPRPNYPDVINMGVAMAKPRSRFVARWRDSLVNYETNHFYHNALELPYKVYERHPNTVHIEPRLQVMCFWLKCHPIFHPQHALHTEDQPFNWRTDVYAIHFTHPDPPEWASQSALATSQGRFADMARHVLSAAGVELPPPPPIKSQDALIDRLSTKKGWS